RDPWHQGVDLVAGELGVHCLTRLGQHVPDRLAGGRRQIIQEPGTATDPTLLQGERQVPGHPHTSANVSDQMFRPSSTSSAVITSGGIIRTVFMYAPQVSISSPFCAASFCAAEARWGSGLPSAVVNSEPTIRPRPRTSPIPATARSRAPESSCSPRSAAFSTRCSSAITSKVALAAAHATALPP